VDGADADDGRGQFHLKHAGVHVAQPFGLVGVALQVHTADERFVAANDHHDQQVRDHHHVDQSQHHQHDDGLVERGDLHTGVVTNAGDQRCQGLLVAKGRFNQVDQFHPEVIDVDALCRDETDVQGQLQPAAGKDEFGQGRDGTIDVGHEESML